MHSDRDLKILTFHLLYKSHRVDTRELQNPLTHRVDTRELQSQKVTKKEFENRELFLRNLIRKVNVNRCYIYCENYKEVIVYITSLKSVFSNLKTSKPAR